MNTVKKIGQPLWTRNDLINKLEEFSQLYDKRPIKGNPYGMLSPHMFLIWFMLQYLKPKYVIESGVYQGVGTWFFEQAVPNAQIFSIDIDLDSRKYISDNVIYCNKDFTLIDWGKYKIIKEETLCFFDDHQNAFKRTQFAKNNGFKALVFEDNYPLNKGNCHSLKQSFYDNNEKDWLYNNLKTYHEMPPVFMSSNHRKFNRWDKDCKWNYPTPKPLYKSVQYDYLQIYYKELLNYTWMCFVELKD